MDKIGRFRSLSLASCDLLGDCFVTGSCLLSCALYWQYPLWQQTPVLHDNLHLAPAADLGPGRQVGA